VQLNGNQSTYTTATSSNRLLSTANPARTFGYDNAGNTTSDTSGYTSTYNLANRLTTLTKAGITSTYSYDANGQRIRKYNSTGAASTVIFVYDQNGQLLGEYNSAGAAIREYVWLGSTPIAIFTPDAVAANPPVAYYIHTDHLDTPRYVFNRAGQRRWRWIAEPFGVTAPETNPDGLGVFAQNLRFLGQFADQESGLNYNYFREYDSSIGRYVQSDPIGLDGGINTYAYALSQPTRYTDPDGRIVPALAWCAANPVCATAAVGATAAIIQGTKNWWESRRDQSDFWDWYDKKHPPYGDPPSDEGGKEKDKKDRCIKTCSKGLPTKDDGFSFWNCVNKCMDEEECK
jgi:RHS repeat-associated protein